MSVTNSQLVAELGELSAEAARRLEQYLELAGEISDEDLDLGLAFGAKLERIMRDELARVRRVHDRLLTLSCDRGALGG